MEHTDGLGIPGSNVCCEGRKAGSWGSEGARGSLREKGEGSHGKTQDVRAPQVEGGARAKSLGWEGSVCCRPKLRPTGLELQGQDEAGPSRVY